MERSNWSRHVYSPAEGVYGWLTEKRRDVATVTISMGFCLKIKTIDLQAALLKIVI